LAEIVNLHSTLGPFIAALIERGHDVDAILAGTQMHSSPHVPHQRGRSCLPCVLRVRQQPVGRLIATDPSGSSTSSHRIAVLLLYRCDGGRWPAY